MSVRYKNKKTFFFPAANVIMPSYTYGGDKVIIYFLLFSVNKTRFSHPAATYLFLILVHRYDVQYIS